MPIIWCAITGHGYGHAAQTVPVLNELGRRISDLSVVLRTTVPERFFQARLTIPWKRSPVDQGGGCVQQGPLSIDLPQTWLAYQEFHRNWDDRVRREIADIQSCSADLILSNISYLALVAGAKARLPSIALASLTWDEIMAGYVEPDNTDHQSVMHHLRDSYRCGDLVIRLMPGLRMEVFQNTLDVGPIAQPPLVPGEAERAMIRWKDEKPLVLVALGGVPMEGLPVEAMEAMGEYQFLVDASVHGQPGRVRSLGDISASFDEIFAQADCVVTKPGYATIIEAVANRKPVIYVRRKNFADEEGLVEYLHQYGRGCEIAKEDFFSGNWQPVLQKVHQVSPPPRDVPESGVGQAANILAGYLS